VWYTGEEFDMDIRKKHTSDPEKLRIMTERQINQ
jgi:hypothetical protein